MLETEISLGRGSVLNALVQRKELTILDDDGHNGMCHVPCAMCHVQVRVHLNNSNFQWAHLREQLHLTHVLLEYVIEKYSYQMQSGYR